MCSLISFIANAYYLRKARCPSRHLLPLTHPTNSPTHPHTHTPAVMAQHSITLPPAGGVTGSRPESSGMAKHCITPPGGGRYRQQTREPWIAKHSITPPGGGSYRQQTREPWIAKHSITPPAGGVTGSRPGSPG